MAGMKEWFVAALVGAGLLGCSAQVEPDYRGEPLVVLRGAVVTGDEAAPSEVDAALVWVSMNDQNGGWPVARVRVRGEFPAQFTIEVFDPPPDPDPRPAGLEDEEPYQTEIGLLAAVAPNSGDRISYDEILGVWLGGGVEYFRRDANGEPGDWVLHESEERKVPPTKGYHLYRYIVTEETEAESFRCRYFDLCWHSVYTGVFGEDLPESPGSTRWAADRQAYFDSEYAKCRKYLDNPTTCTEYWPWGEPLAPEEQAEQDRCSELQTQTFERVTAAYDNKWSCPSAWRYVENPEGFDYPVSIELGTNQLEWADPRLRE